MENPNLSIPKMGNPNLSQLGNPNLSIPRSNRNPNLGSNKKGLTSTRQNKMKEGAMLDSLFVGLRLAHRLATVCSS
jgi:hypothetical protein